MVARRTADQFVVIVGPTASGKTDLAIKIAKEFKGEVISADSRTIYKGLDISTAKPSIQERQGVTHYGFDLVEPDRAFSAAQFKTLAEGWIKDIQARGKLPIMVGGTGLYIDSILFNYQFGGPSDPALRERLSAMSLEQLWDYCKENNISLPENYKNKRYVIRAIERGKDKVSKKYNLRPSTIVVGITLDREVLRQRIHDRAQSIFSKGVVEETTKIAKEFGWQAPGLSGIVHPIIRKLVEGELSQDSAVQQFVTADWQLAKRQLTWLKRNPAITWHESPSDAYLFLKEYLSKTI